MNWRVIILPIFLVSSALADGKGATNAAPRNSYEAFQIISQRNIFNPNRSGGSRRQETRESEKPARTESLALVGTMLWEKGNFAFFDSSSSDYRKVLKPDDTIAGYKVTEVTPNGVKLEANGKTVQLEVGQQLQRRDEGEWAVTGKPAETVSTNSSKESSSGSASGSADDDEVLKRLLKKREEELNK